MESPTQQKRPAPAELQHRHAAYAAEATGLLIVAVVLLVATLIRFWHFIPWSAR